MSLVENECFICRKHRGLDIIPGGAVYEDDLIHIDHAWSSEDQEATYLGAFIVEPKRHVPTWAELSNGEAERMGRGIRDVSRALKVSEAAEHIYVFVFGHHVPHLHVWVVPRYTGTPREYWALELFEWPARPRGTAEGVEEICWCIREAIGSSR